MLASYKAGPRVGCGDGNGSGVGGCCRCCHRRPHTGGSEKGDPTNRHLKVTFKTLKRYAKVLFFRVPLFGSPFSYPPFRIPLFGSPFGGQ